MKIGIDLDGVVFDSDRLFENLAELFDIENGGKGKSEGFRFLEEAYGWTEEVFQKFKDKYLDDILEKSHLMILAKDILFKLKDAGHELIVITNRGSLEPREKEITLTRFKNEGLNFDKIEFTKGSKAFLCKEHKIDIMIDNSPHVVEEVANNGIVCLYFRDNTKEINHPNVFTVHNWAEIYRFIKNKEKLIV